jgi:two-component system sensor histidine kinase DctS
VDINAVVKDAVGLLSREVSRHHIDLSFSLDTNLPEVMADPILIEQVVANLVRNACDALGTSSGPRRLSVQTTLAPGHRFAPFYSTKADGMGMGLAICRSIVELHYGALDARDETAGGASLSFTVPLALHDDEEEST